MKKLESADFDRNFRFPEGFDFLLIFLVTGGGLYADFDVEFTTSCLKLAPFSIILLSVIVS